MQKTKAAPDENPNATTNNNLTLIHPKGKSKGNGGYRGKCLSINHTVYAVAIKVYDEQLVRGWKYTCDQIKKYPSHDMPKNEMEVYSVALQILAILHDTDILDGDDFWAPAYEKPHYQIIARASDRKGRIRIGTLLKFLGIEFRKGIDDELLKHHAVETVGNFARYATYLTHETDDAIADGKALYDVTKIVSNLTPEEVEQVRAGYARVSNATHRITQKEWVQIDNCAFQLGYELKNFDEFFDAQPFNVRSSPKFKTVKESFQRGTKRREAKYSQVVRLCIFISGPPNTGKTYAAEHSVPGSHLRVGGGGTGKFDNLSPSTNAIIVDDDVCDKNLLILTDNYNCRIYKRGKDNPLWTGNYFIVTSNSTFDEWLYKCGVDSDEWDAIHSRFYICEIAEKDGYSYLKCTQCSKRGTQEEQQKRLDMFNDFKNKFDQTIAGYRPSEIKHIDYSSAYANPMAGKSLEQTKPEESSTPNEQCEQPAHKEISTTDEPFEQAELEKTPVVAEPYKQPKPEEISAAAEPCKQPAPEDLFVADEPCEQVEQLTISDCFACDDSPADEPQEQAKPEKIPLNPKAPMGDLLALGKMLSEQLSGTDAVVDIRD